MAQTKDQNTTNSDVHNQADFGRQTIARIAGLFAAPAIIPPLKPCPFCLSDPELDGAFHGRAVIYCNEDECEARPQVTGKTIADAAKCWNRRNHLGVGGN